MRFFRLLALAWLFTGSIAALAQTPSYKNIGRSPTQQEIEEWDISIGPDGKGLPAGSGTAKLGNFIFAAKCAVCHGPDGRGGKIGTQLVTNKEDFDSLTTMKPVRAVADYWPYATMIWDYIHRAMPRNQAGTLSPNEVYSLTAFILAKSNVIKEDDVLDATSLPKVQMPNRNGFVPARFADIPDEKKRGCKQGVCP